MAEPPTLLRRQLGRFLRDRRDATGMTIAIAATQVQLSSAALQRLEAGRSKNPRKQDVRELCTLYEVSPEETEKAVDLAIKAAAKDDGGVVTLGGMFSEAFNMYAGMERSARKMTTFQELVPGLLQTADYARGIISAGFLDRKPEEIEPRVSARMKRQLIVRRKYSPLQLEVLLHESALHRVVGFSQTMAAQMRELAEISKLPNVTLRIQPFKAGCTWGKLPGGFVILDFGTDNRGNLVEPPVIYLEGAMSGDLYIEKQEIVDRYYELAGAIRRTALDETSTRDLLRQVAREYDRER